LGLDLEDFRWLELKSDRLCAGRANVFACSYFSGSAGLAMSPEITTRSGRADKRF
jgi:hypothetical protein